MNRKQVRYLLFRLKTEAEGGVEPPKLPRGFKKTFSAQQKFQGWISFGVTWDVGGRILDEFQPNEDTTSEEDSHWTIVMRDKSLDEAWNDQLRKSFEVPEEDEE